METQKVWAPEPNEGYVLGVIVDISANEVTVQPNDRKIKTIVSRYDRVFPADENDNKDVEDNCALMFLNEATLLNNVRIRYSKDRIYTYVANILIAINPYFEVPDLYTSANIKRYQGKSLGTLPPHVYAIADKAFRDMKSLKESQSLIVSGESGAGKTESTKYILRYLCECWGSQAGPIEQRILEANPVLEAFGNAKTVRNNNSSRFGKFIEIHFNEKHSVVGGFISHYLLEKARICSQATEERNYHIFFQLLAGAPDKLREALRLTNPDDFKYLNQGCTQYFASNNTDKTVNANRKSNEQRRKGFLQDPLLDDANDFLVTDKGLSHFGLNEAERLAIYQVVAAVLHLGNVTFEDNPEDAKGGCKVATSSEQSAKVVADLMGVDPEELRQSLVSRVMQASKGGHKGTIIMVPLKTYEANGARDALAKAMYSRIFDYIVNRINKSIPFSSSSQYIGVLDIAGFEYFAKNGFEQFCINYCNEKLQQFFNERVLKDEQLLYSKEGLNVKKIDYTDNQECIDLIEGKGNGIFQLLDEESKLPKPNQAHFTSSVHSKNNNHFWLDLPRKSKLRDHREIRDDEGFIIKHFAGAVCYNTNQFIEKNNDALHASLEALVQESKNKLLRELFEGDLQSSKGKLSFISVGSKFRSQLQELMTKLRSTGTSFIRCVKPNLKMVTHSFDGGQILNQLQCSGMTTVLDLMQQGYPSRAQFSDLYNMYKAYLPPELSRLDPRLFCKSLFRALGLNENDFKFGMTKVFFRPGKFSEFDQVMKSDPENLAILVKKVKKWLLGSRWKKAQWCSLSVIKLKNKILYRRSQIVKIQKNIRMWLAKKKYRHRYLGAMKVRKLKDHLAGMSNIIVQLKAEQQKCRADADKLGNSIDSLLKKIQTTPMKREEIEKEHAVLTAAINEQLKVLTGALQKQKSAEEQERLRKIQEQMERERKQKEEEERKRKQEEEDRKLKAEMEARRKAEEEQRKKAEAANRKEAAKYEAEHRKEQEEMAKMQAKDDQERRDYKLAAILAKENNGHVEEYTSGFTRTGSTSSLKSRNSSSSSLSGKNDLTKWKYADLRDAINTSTDVAHLAACREEFHRRLKVYHAWKNNNTKNVDNSRVPKNIAQEAEKAPPLPPRTASLAGNKDRYFRIPFIKTGKNVMAEIPDDVRGWWYAHFEGQFVARQMEVFQSQTPLLLVVGKDDLQMCDLTLEETGLVKKKGSVQSSNLLSRYIRCGF